MDTPDTSERQFDTDVAVIGSGFGGSVAAHRLTEKGYSVTVLEKGRRWQPDDFPKTNWNIRKSFWFPYIGCRGIFGLRLLREALVLHGVGVGGGSLVYANTLFEPPGMVWDDPQWRGLEDWREIMGEHYETARKMLGVVENPKLGPADEALRHAAARRGRDSSFKHTPVGIYFGTPDETVPDPYFDGKGPPRTGCNFCGGCMVGCRPGAKNTLDKNYLYLAERAGAKVVPDTRVTFVEALAGGGYRLHWRRTRGILSKASGSMTAARVVFSAGVLGTVPLLMESKERGGLPRISDQIGNFVRTNSEALLGVTSKTRKDLWEGVAIAAKVEIDEVTHFECVRFSKGSDVMLLLGTMLTDGGGRLPRPLRWLGNVIRHPLDFLRVLKPWGKAESSTVVMAMQTADNHTRLVRKRQWLWPFTRTLTTQPDPDQPGIPSYIPVANEIAREVAEELDGIPQSSVNEVFLDTSSTAHILGGCGIGADHTTGVIDSSGRVFGHEGLYVMDGSMIGANLGVNPSLTITALSEHVCSRIPAKSAEQVEADQELESVSVSV
jgi:cholesterol oxidase